MEVLLQREVARSRQHRCPERLQRTSEKPMQQRTMMKPALLVTMLMLNAAR